MSERIRAEGSLMHDLSGQTLGQYRIIEPLGQGGMALVFKAFQPSLERYVAVKVLPPHFAHTPGFTERFTREARAVARLEHPHILPVHDFGQEGEYTYIAMKYVPTGTLRDLMLAGEIDLARATEIIGQIAQALDYAHEQGIIHRDVKPSNVLMDRGRWALLMDFGLARMVEGSSHLTASGVGVGTPAYMAPEQGLGRQADHRADIYSLGVVLYEMLTGQVPFDAETPMAIVIRHITDPVPPPRTVNPSIPEAFELVTLKALDKDPENRYGNCAQIAEALRSALLSTTENGNAFSPIKAELVSSVIAEIPLAPPEEEETTTEPPTADTPPSVPSSRGCPSCTQTVLPITINGKQYCPECGIPLSESAQSHPAAIGTVTDQSVNCPSCTNVISPLRIAEILYCPECGVRLP